MIESGEQLTLATRDQAGRFWNIGSFRNGKIRTDKYGFLSADFTLDEDFATPPEEVGFDNQIYFFNCWGDVMFHGRLDVVTPTWNGLEANIPYTAKGYKDSATDGKFNGTLIGTPEARIAALISGGYLPQLSTDTTGLITTGIASGTTATNNSGTDDMTPWDVILNICKSGTSAGLKVLPQVWEDRKLITKAVDMVTPTPRYIVDRANVKQIALSRTLSDVYTQVVVRYKDIADGSLKRLVVPASTSAIATALGVDFTGGGTITPFIRTRVLDISNILPDGCDAATATAAGTALLNEVQRVSNVYQAIRIEQDYVIFDRVEGQEISNVEVRGGEWIYTNGFSVWPNDAATGSPAGDKTIQPLFFISGTEVDLDDPDFAVNVVPESSGDVADAVNERLEASV